MICDVRLTKVNTSHYGISLLARIMDNKFISRDALRKRKARENETPSQHEARLAKQRESRLQKKAKETAKE